MRIESVRIDEIVIGDRHRKNLGDLAELASSIREHGLLQPIGVTADRKLLFGHRRLEASKQVPLESVDARIFEHFDDAVEALKLERDENTCRKDFTKSEAVSLGRELEKLERAKAEKRMAATQAKPGQKVGQGSGNFPEPSDRGETRDKVGAAVGMSGVTYTRAKAVVEAAESDPEKFGHLVEAMDEKSVNAAYQELKQARDAEGEPKNKPAATRAEEIRGLVVEGYNSGQIAERLGISKQRVRELARQHDIVLPDAGRSRRVDPRRVIETTVTGLEGYVQGLESINGHMDGVTIDDATAWSGSLDKSLKALRGLKKRLTEVANGNE